MHVSRSSTSRRYAHSLLEDVDVGTITPDPRLSFIKICRLLRSERRDHDLMNTYALKKEYEIAILIP